MELLEFSVNNSVHLIMKPLEQGVSSSNLETVIVGECSELKRMFFRGCTKLKNLLFRGRNVVRNLDILGTAVKTLDFSATAWGPFFELCLLNCEKLCAILWPPRLHLPDDKFKLLIDTTQSVSSARYREDGGQVGSIAATQTAVAAPHEHGNRRTTEFGWHISVRDERLLFSLESVYGSSRVAYVEVSSPARPTVTAGFIKDEAIMCGKNNEHQVATHLQRQPGPAAYADTSVARLHQQAKEDQGDAPVIMSMWPCPDPPSLPENRCYMHIQDRNWTKVPTGGEETSDIVVPEFLQTSAKILHVHDSVSITAIPSAMMRPDYAEWRQIEWCRIERCPELKSVFIIPEGSRLIRADYSLRIIWASQLLKACYICRWVESSFPSKRCFPYLNCCTWTTAPGLYMHSLCSN